MKTITTFISYEYTVTPAEYLAMPAAERANIKEIEVIPPRLGSNNFGMFKIIRKHPVYSPILR